MAAFYDGYTLCGIVPPQTPSDPWIQGIEAERDSDHVIITDSTRSVTLFKVSDQRPLGSWTVKQGQHLTCPAVYNCRNKEYVSVTDKKVIRIWKEDDINLDKAFKATVASDIWRIHCAAGVEPVVLFQKGAVRFLDSLLSAPQQPIEEVLAPEEVIIWSIDLVAKSQQFIIYVTEKEGDHFFYLHKLNTNTLQRFQLEREEPALSPVSFSASYRNNHICLLYLYPNGHLYQSVISVLGFMPDKALQETLLPRGLLLDLSVGESLLEAASALILDEDHVVVAGVPHPSVGADKDFLCIWNTNFQTLQAAKEIGAKIFGQLRNFSNKLFIPHGKTLSIIPYDCAKSSLASALGKLKPAKTQESKTSASVPSWNKLLHGENIQTSTTMETRKTRASHKNQAAPYITLDQVLELIKIGSIAEVQHEVEVLVSRECIQDLEPSIGRLTLSLVSRSLADPNFYTPDTLARLVHTQCLCHSLCPDLVLLALEKKDYFLCQLCLQYFPDIPEAVICACLKAFISLPDIEADTLSLEPDSLLLMEALTAMEPKHIGLQNGFGTTSLVEDGYSGTNKGGTDKKKTHTLPQPFCPVGLRKAVLLNEVLQMTYSDDFLLPHLKDLSSKHVILFLQYLQFLYSKYSQNVLPQMHGWRSPSLTQIMDWVCLLLDAHFTVLVMTPEAKSLLLNLHTFVKSQVRLFLEFGKIKSSLQEINKMTGKKDVGQYSIEIIELF